MPLKASTTGSKTWTPSILNPPPSASTDNNSTPQSNDTTTQIHQHLLKNNLRSAIITAFQLPPDDNYIYHATASVTLAQVQTAINAGPSNGLHDWYLDDSGDPLHEYPPTQDIQSYISLFDPSKSFVNTLKSFKSNAKKNSLRSSIADNLIQKRHLDTSIVLPRRKTHHFNPYLDFWAWSCHSLQYAGPNTQTSQVKMSHHVLPVFMHHFGCVCPSYESLTLIQHLASIPHIQSSSKTPTTSSDTTSRQKSTSTTPQKLTPNLPSSKTPRTILDIGSGNGYWTYLLRTTHSLSVIAIDNIQSTWRTTWIPDTIISDGLTYLESRENGIDDLLLLVYPIVSTDFTRNIISTFKGDVLCVVGTQNGNGYTAFEDGDVDKWIEENRPGEWEMVARLPLPSFAGKDDAIFGFRRKIGR